MSEAKASTATTGHAGPVRSVTLSSRRGGAPSPGGVRLIALSHLPAGSSEGGASGAGEAPTHRPMSLPVIRSLPWRPHVEGCKCPDCEACE
jgi:hypothetical protein